MVRKIFYLTTQDNKRCVYIYSFVALTPAPERTTILFALPDWIHSARISMSSFSATCKPATWSARESISWLFPILIINCLFHGTMMIEVLWTTCNLQRDAFHHRRTTDVSRNKPAKQKPNPPDEWWLIRTYLVTLRAGLAGGLAVFLQYATMKLFDNNVQSVVLIISSLARGTGRVVSSALEKTKHRGIGVATISDLLLTCCIPSRSV